MSMNLLQETLDFLREHKKYIPDVEFVSIDLDGHNEVSCDFSEFAEVAKDLNYDCGLGQFDGDISINFSLKIVGRHWWLERYTCDNQEMWLYHERPRKPHAARKLEKADFLWNRGL